MNSDGLIWVALDTDRDRALRIADAVAKDPAVGVFKLNRTIDQEAVRPDGPSLFKRLNGYGVNLFADIKLKDVPRTVAARIEPYANSEWFKYLTVMADGEIDMMIAAVIAGGTAIDIIAVTELTSLSEEQVHLGSGKPNKASVIYLARNAVLAGLQHLVCSAQEVGVVCKRPELESLLLCVPGITPAYKQGQAPSDQQRIGTPAAVLKAGGRRVAGLIIGSAIVDDPDPLEAVKRIADEIESV